MYQNASLIASVPFVRIKRIFTLTPLLGPFVRLQRAAEGVARTFNQRFDFGRADQLAKLAQG